MKLHRPLAVIGIIAVVGACGGQPQALPRGTPALGQWPPMRVAEDIPAGITLQQVNEEFILTNGSQRPVWLSPPTLEVWSGRPWTVPATTPTGVDVLSPGARRTFPTRLPDGTVRVGVELWPSATPDYANGDPWFLWLEPQPVPRN